MAVGPSHASIATVIGEKLHAVPHSTVMSGPHGITGGFVSTTVKTAIGKLPVDRPNRSVTTTKYSPAVAPLATTVRLGLFAPETGIELRTH
jgi:hypothetical protein